MDRFRFATSFVAISAFSACLLVSIPVAYAANGDCAQPVSDGASPVASDALFILGAAVGLQVCDACICDVDNSGAVTAADALRALGIAVGQQIALLCEPCSIPCDEGEAPTCGGNCPQGLTCGVDQEFPDECDCFSPCGLSEAPTCGGSCDVFGDGSVCTALSVENRGNTIDLCRCLAPGAAVCEQASSPECIGVCAPGTICESDGGSGCICAQLPIQGECSSATAPDCLGTCVDSGPGLFNICESDGAGSCICVPFEDGGDESCFFAGAPTCGGVCAFGEICAVDLFGNACECHDPCEVSAAPACGGSCDGHDEVCTVTTITLSGQTKAICECLPGPEPCETSEAPTCGGTCLEGSTCEPTGPSGGCQCQVEQSIPCDSADAPTCGGDCPTGEICTDNPDGGGCNCFTGCELSSAPTCGGSCEGDPSGFECTSITIQVGQEVEEICECMPPNATFCEFTSATGCNGICTPDSICGSDGGSGCMCTQQPPQPDCGAASAPTCAGRCPDGQSGERICEFDGVDGCSCVPYTGQQESCFAAGAPTCGGTCAFGEVCGVEPGIDVCECLDPCEVSAAPACGGECSDPGEECVALTITVNGESKEFCECN